MHEEKKLATPWRYTYEDLLNGLVFYGHSSVWVNEGKPNVMLFAESDPFLVLKRASWGTGRIILIDASELESDLADSEPIDESAEITKIVLNDAPSQLAHNTLAQLGHKETIDGPRTAWRLSHKKLKEMEAKNTARHIPILENKNSFFNQAQLSLPSLQTWHFFEVTQAFIRGEDIATPVLEQYYDLLLALSQRNEAQGGHGKLELPCLVGGGLGKASYFNSVNTDFLSRITGSYHIKTRSFAPDNKSHVAHLKAMPKDFYLWLNATVIGNEDKPLTTSELIGTWQEVMRHNQ